jgi:putative transposase
VPWRESSPMSERLAFIQACLDRSEAIVRICDRFGISEKTGYKLLKRFREEGPAALSDRSRARLTHPYRITPDVAAEIVAIRKQYPLYGPQTIRDILRHREPEKHWPAASSIGDLLKRENLVRSKRRRHMPIEHAALETGRTRAFEPNFVWTADFKGEFRLGPGGAYCYPLTVMDLHSRYLLGCTALATTAVASARRVFTRLFREYGLPRVIRTDNGVPFAQPNALGRLGQLGFWWVRLGIRPEHTKPATPSENGAHERFHKTLKAAATKPASLSMHSQQRRFDDFRTEYNEHRPHRSLPDRKPPASLYTSSERSYPKRLPRFDYPSTSAVRLVDTSGNIKWQGDQVFISGNLAGDYVALTEGEGDLLAVAFAQLELGHYDCVTKWFIPKVRWSGET